MKKLSKITDVKGNGSWTHDQYGLFYSYEYKFEDETVLVANSKSDTCPFNIGDTVEYEITKDSQEHGKSGKVSKPQEEGQTNRNSGNFIPDPKKQVIITVQSSMTKAIDILLSGVTDTKFHSIKDFVDKTESLTDLLLKKQIQLTQKHLESFKAI